MPGNELESANGVCSQRPAVTEAFPLVTSLKGKVINLIAHHYAAIC